MKRRDLLKRLTRMAADRGVEFAFIREGANHSVYSFGGIMIPVGRHREIPETTAQKILKEAEA